MNISEIEQLVALVNGANIGELTLRHEGAAITIRRAPTHSLAQGTALVPTSGHSHDDFNLDMSEDASDEFDDAEEADAEDDTIMVKSPRVGAFRHAKKPVALGSIVKEGQVLGSIEAMRLPSDVVAPRAGKIVEVFVEEGQFAEYGQDLFAIQPGD